MSASNSHSHSVLDRFLEFMATLMYIMNHFLLNVGFSMLEMVLHQLIATLKKQSFYRKADEYM